MIEAHKEHGKRQQEERRLGRAGPKQRHSRALSATIQANIPTLKKRFFVGSLKSISMAPATAACSPAGRFAVLRARILVLIPATASPIS